MAAKEGVTTMADIVELEQGVFVAGQLRAADFDRLAALGVRAVVSNRPDGEAEGQLDSGAAAAAARRNGLSFRYLPVASVDVAEDGPVADFAAAVAELAGPVLFYCGTGTRAALLWAQASVARLGVGETVGIAGRAGFDLSPYADILEERAAAASLAAAA